MTTLELRKIYQREILPPLFLDNPDGFYEAFNNGPEAVKEYIAQMWTWMCEKLEENALTNSLHFDMDCLALDESDTNFIALLTVELPEINAPVGSEVALYFSVFFGALVQPRLFFGEYTQLKAPNDTIAVVEIHILKGDELKRTPHSILYQGCNNEPIVFEPPAHPLKVNPKQPLIRDEWYTAYMDEVVKICASGINN